MKSPKRVRRREAFKKSEGAIFELLAEKGILTKDEVTDRIKKLKTETKVNLRRPN